jgi:hypothetical protein
MTKTFKLVVESRYGVVGGEEMRDIVSIFPEAESSFTQRKQYDEYYFNSGIKVEVTMDKIVSLTDEVCMGVEFRRDEIKITC